MLKRFIVLMFFLSFLLGLQALAVEPEGLILYLSFDEGSGDVAQDGSGKGNDGDINGAQWVNDGKIGKALELDGSSFVEVASSDSLEALHEEITIAAWILPYLSGGEWQGIITKGADVSEHFELLLNRSGHLHTAWVFSTGRSHTNPGAAGTISAGEWRHVAVTYKPGEWITYLDGEVLSNLTNVDGKMTPDGRPLVVGDEKGSSRFFQGLIDEVAVFNRALSADEVNQIMRGIGSLMSVDSTGKVATTWAGIKR